MSQKLNKESCVDDKVQKIIVDVYCATCRNRKCVYISTNKVSSFYYCTKCNACCHILNIPFKDQKPTFMLFGGDGTQCLVKTRVVTTKLKKNLFSGRIFAANHNQPHPNLNQRKQKFLHLWQILVYFPLVDTVN